MQRPGAALRQQQLGLVGIERVLVGVGRANVFARRIVQARDAQLGAFHVRHRLAQLAFQRILVLADFHTDRQPFIVVGAERLVLHRKARHAVLAFLRVQAHAQVALVEEIGGAHAEVRVVRVAVAERAVIVRRDIVVDLVFDRAWRTGHIRRVGWVDVGFALPHRGRVVGVEGKIAIGPVRIFRDELLDERLRRLVVHLLDARFFLAAVGKKRIDAAVGREQPGIAHGRLAVTGNVVVADALERQLDIGREILAVVDVHAQALGVGIVVALAQHQFQFVVLVFHRARQQAGIDIDAAADRVAAVAHAVRRFADGGAARKQRVERNVDVAADGVHAQDRLAIFEDLHAAAGQAADHRRAGIGAEGAALHARDVFEHVAERAILGAVVLDRDAGVAAGRLVGADFNGLEGGVVGRVGA